MPRLGLQLTYGPTAAMFLNGAFGFCCSGSADCSAVCQDSSQKSVELPAEDDEEVEDLQAHFAGMFVVKLSRKGSDPLGVEFDKMDPENLMVVKLTGPGLFHTYNETADHEKMVCPGDKIKRVNGQEAPAEELIALLEKERKLTLVLQHCQESEHYIEKKGRSLGLELAVSEKATCLTVQRIEATGLVAVSNQAGRDRQIRVHDKIIAVDGERGAAPELMRKMKERDVVILSVFSWDA